MTQPKAVADVIDQGCTERCTGGALIATKKR